MVLVIQMELLGRSEELTTLKNSLEALQSGSGGLLLICGEAGLGKTTLVKSALQEIAAPIFEGRALENRTPPYGPLAAALRACLREDINIRKELGSFGDHLGMLLPELGATSHTDRDTMLEAVCAAFTKAAEKSPFVLFLDDLHWADNATLDSLPILAERLSSEPVLVIATYRTDEITRTHPIRRLRTELRRMRLLNETQLTPFSREESDHLLAKILEAQPEKKLAEAVHRHANGISFYIEEFAAALQSGGYLRRDNDIVALDDSRQIPIPDSVRDAVLMRMESLSENAQRMLEVSAVAGTEFELALILEVADGDAGLDELLESGFINEEQPGVGMFRHELMREAVMREIIWSRRRELHAATAEFLENRNGPIEIIAHHWLAAQETEKAREALLESADHLCIIHAHRDAAKAASQALEIWPKGKDEKRRVATLQRMAHCAKISGLLPEATLALREAVESPLLTENPIQSADIYRTLATIYDVQNKATAAMGTRRKAIELFIAAERPGEAAVELIAVTYTLIGSLRLKEAQESIEEAAGLVKKTDENLELRARTMSIRGWVLAMRGRFQKGRDSVQEGLSFALKHNLAEAAAEAYYRLGSVLEYSSDFIGANEAYSTALNNCHQEGIENVANHCMSCLAYLLFRIGDWSKAIDVSRKVLAMESDSISSDQTALVTLGLINAYRGELKQARKNLEEVSSMNKQRASVLYDIFLDWGFAIVEEYEGNEDAARELMTRLLEQWDRSEEQQDGIQALCRAATLFGRHGSENEIAICSDNLSRIAAECGNPQALAALAHALGEMALLRGEHSAAAEHFLQATEQMEKLHMRIEQAHSLWRCGIAFAKSDQQEEGVRHLTNAYRMARNLGMRPLASVIAAELETLGEAVEDRRGPRVDGRTIKAGLTRRQLEVLRQVAGGHTNKEIGERLYLSTRTVDMHMRNILDRLNCRSRTEAISKATELELL